MPTTSRTRIRSGIVPGGPGDHHGEQRRDADIGRRERKLLGTELGRQACQPGCCGLAGAGGIDYAAAMQDTLTIVEDLEKPGDGAFSHAQARRVAHAIAQVAGGDRLPALERGVADLDKRVAGLDTRVGDLDRRVTDLDKRVAVLTWMVGANLALTIAVLVKLLAL